MDSTLKQTLWNQLGAAIDMLENALIMCPEELWDTDSKFWYNGYHVLFFLDYYLTEEPEKFLPPEPFTLSEFEPDTMPERVYTKEELLRYLGYCRKKCNSFINGLTEDSIKRRWVNDYKNFSIPELLIYNLRHVQHHVAQLNMILRQQINDAPKWVSQAKTPL